MCGCFSQACWRRPSPSGPTPRCFHPRPNDFHWRPRAEGVRLVEWPAGSAAPPPQGHSTARPRAAAVGAPPRRRGPDEGTLGSNLVFGRSVVEVMNAIGLDAAVVGNHELDWGVDTLRARMREARYPWLAANVFDSLTGARPGWALPFRTLERGGMRVAVVGYMAGRTKQMVGAAEGRGLVCAGGGGHRRRDGRRAGRAPRPHDPRGARGRLLRFAALRGEIGDLARELPPERWTSSCRAHPLPGQHRRQRHPDHAGAQQRPAYGYADLSARRRIPRVAGAGETCGPIRHPDPDHRHLARSGPWWSALPPGRWRGSAIPSPGRATSTPSVT